MLTMNLCTRNVYACKASHDQLYACVGVCVSEFTQPNMFTYVYIYIHIICIHTDSYGERARGRERCVCVYAVYAYKRTHHVDMRIGNTASMQGCISA